MTIHSKSEQFAVLGIFAEIKKKNSRDCQKQIFSGAISVKNCSLLIMALACTSVQAQVIPTGYSMTFMNAGGTHSEVNGILPNGKVFGNKRTGDFGNATYQPFTWSRETGYTHIALPSGVTSMFGNCMSPSGLMGGTLEIGGQWRGFVREPNGNFTILPNYSTSLFPNDTVQDIQDNGDFMLWSAKDLPNLQSGTISRWFHGDGTFNTYSGTNSYYLPNPSGLQKYGFYPQEYFEGIIRQDGSSVLSPRNPIVLQDDNDIFTDREFSENSLRVARLQRFNSNGQLVWESPSYSGAALMAAPKNANIGYALVKKTPSSATKTYITLFGGELIDMAPLLPSNLSSVRITGANDAGQLIGYGTVAGVQNQYFVLTPVPEPATMVAIGLGLAGLARKRKKTA